MLPIVMIYSHGNWQRIAQRNFCHPSLAFLSMSFWQIQIYRIYFMTISSKTHQKKGYHQAITEGKNLSSNDFQSEDLERGKMLLCPWSRCWSLLMPRSSWLLPLEVIENRRRCEKLWVRPRTNWPSKPSSADQTIYKKIPWSGFWSRFRPKPAQPKTKRRAREGETRRDWLSKSTIHFNE